MFFFAGAQAFSFAFFGQGTGPIHIDNVQCVGTEATLLECTHLTVDNCVHAEDAGVRCQGCANGDLRLIGGTTISEGRVEICMASTWGTVCDDFWGAPDARVVCRQLGYSTVRALAFDRAFFGAGTGQILLDNVQCAGTEARLADCTARTVHNCNHGQDAGVLCVAMRELCGIKESGKLSTLLHPCTQLAFGTQDSTLCDPSTLGKHFSCPSLLSLLKAEMQQQN